MQHFTFWVHLHISHNFQYIWKFQYFLKPTNEKFIHQISEFLRKFDQKTKLNRVSEFWKQDVESNTSFPPFKWFSILWYVLNLDSWRNYQEFNMCVVLTRDFEVKKQQKVLTYKRLNFTYMMWFSKCVWFH